MRTGWLTAVCAIAVACNTPATVRPAAIEAKEPAPRAQRADVRWTLPSCPLAYHVLVRELTAIDETEVEIERFLSLDATTKSGRMQLEGVVVGRVVKDGVHEPARPDADHAPVLLETDGLAWTEREGPSLLFTHVTSMGGLVWFFPTLPASAKPAAWEVPTSSAMAAFRVEARRGRRPALEHLLERPEDDTEKDAPGPTHAEVRFEKTQMEGGVAVSTFAMTAERVDAWTVPAEVTLTSSFRGSYAITASGRLLRASVEASRTTAMAMSKVTAKATGKMHLVRACDGSLEPVLTAEEKAAPADDSIRIEPVPLSPKKR